MTLTEKIASYPTKKVCENKWKEHEDDVWADADLSHLSVLLLHLL